MTQREFSAAEQTRWQQCAESFHWTEQCLLRSRSCLQRSYDLFADRPRVRIRPERDSPFLAAADIE